MKFNQLVKLTSDVTARTEWNYKQQMLGGDRITKTSGAICRVFVIQSHGYIVRFEDLTFADVGFDGIREFHTATTNGTIRRGKHAAH